MRKKYSSPLFAELEIEDVLYNSDEEFELDGGDFNEDDFEAEEDFTF